MLSRTTRKQPPILQELSLTSRFLAVNRDKLRRVHDSLTLRQRDLLDILPLLFHVNQRRLPGYISQHVAAGLPDYAPERSALQAAKRLVPSFKYKPHLSKHFDIKGLYLMGSPGTVGYSKTSDIDIWLVHDPDLEPQQVIELNAKARKIEAFAATLGLEMHFFVFDAVRFRCGETLSLSDESSGSSQHYLLLDEFYRSGLLVAGLPPMWWAVPITEEHRYDEYVEQSIVSGLIKEKDYVDFGGMANVPADEFFGVAVWHLYKSIDSPYKSVLKLLLIEIYAAKYPASQLLSHRYKEKIAAKQASLNDLDPYLEMYRIVEEYLVAENDLARLDLVRRSFYIKTNVRLSNRSDTRIPDWQRDTLQELTSSWDWMDFNIRHLDNRGSWKVPFATKERRILIKALQQSYVALSKFARDHSHNQKITQTDLNILGRKLYAVFQKKPSKIDIVTRGICPDPWESALSLHSKLKPNGETRWILYSGTITPDKTSDHNPLMEATTPSKLIAWCYFNRVVKKFTHWSIFDSTRRLDVAAVHKAIDSLHENFPTGTPAGLKLGAAARPLKALLIVNLGVDPTAGKVRDGGVLTSNRTDAFQFGGQRVNLVRSVDMIMMTSWEEMFVFHFDGDTGLTDAIIEYLQWGTPLGTSALPDLAVRCLSKDYASSIGQRVKNYAFDVIKALNDGSENTERQFVVQIERRYCRTFVKNRKPCAEYHANRASLIKALSTPNSIFNTVVFDPSCRNIGLLDCIYRINKSGVIQLVVHNDADNANIYALDEFGTLFTHRQECYRIDMIFDQYLKFIRNFLNNDPQSSAFSTNNFADDVIELYHLKPSPHDPFRLVEIAVTTPITNEYLPIRVFVDVDNAGKQQFTMFCKDIEFSSAQHGGRLFVAMAEYIYSQRAASETYPIYITDLELSNRFKSHHDIHTQLTIYMLNCKKRIEHQLTRALQHDVSPSPEPLSLL